MVGYFSLSPPSIDLRTSREMLMALVLTVPMEISVRGKLALPRIASMRNARTLRGRSPQATSTEGTHSVAGIRCAMVEDDITSTATSSRSWGLRVAGRVAEVVAVSLASNARLASTIQAAQMVAEADLVAVDSVDSSQVLAEVAINGQTDRDSSGLRSTRLKSRSELTICGKRGRA